MGSVVTSAAERPPPIVEVCEVTRIFDAAEPVVALDRISLAVHPGQFVALEGPSGCGKSTLLHLLGGLDLATHGVTRFEGQDYRSLDDETRSDLRRRRIGLVLPVVDLVAALRVWENVAISLLLAGGRLSAGRERAHDLLGEVGLAHRADAYAGRLSAGEAQRGALARALFNRPRLLLADEPTSSLDSVRSDEILGLLRRLADDGQAIVMATHNARAAAFADRSIRLRDGRLVGG